MTDLDPFRKLKWKDIEHVWDNAEGEHNYWVPKAKIIGKIPNNLRGTLFRNGPGNVQNIYGIKPIHPIDGDGYICALTFINGAVHFKSKFVNTKTRQKEKERKEFLYPGQMGTRHWADIRLTDAFKALMGRRIKLEFRDPSNTNVFLWGGKLVTCYETKLPHVLDPSTLKTIGPDNMNKTLHLKVLAAHFRIDYDSLDPTLVCFGLRPSLNKPRLGIYEYDNKWNCKIGHEVNIPGLNYSHDFLLT
eukprot:UN28607